MIKICLLACGAINQGFQYSSIVKIGIGSNVKPAYISSLPGCGRSEGPGMGE